MTDTYVLFSPQTRDFISKIHYSLAAAQSAAIESLGAACFVGNYGTLFSKESLLPGEFGDLQIIEVEPILHYRYCIIDTGERGEWGFNELEKRDEVWNILNNRGVVLRPKEYSNFQVWRTDNNARCIAFVECETCGWVTTNGLEVAFKTEAAT